MVKMIPLETVRWRLGAIWFCGAGLIFSIVIVQSLANVFEDNVQGVWGWLLPNIIPTLSVIIGVFAAAALRDELETDKMYVRRNFAHLAVGLSTFHLGSLAVTILAHPFLGTVDGLGGRPLRLFETSNIWLGPLQGLVAAVISALFFSKAGKPTGVERAGEKL